MFCTIGIAAYNEEKTLPAMLNSLKQQMLPKNWKFHTIVVANGCTDNTVHTALTFGLSNWGKPHAFQSGKEQWWNFTRDSHNFSVCEVPIAKKSYALNIIHRSSPSGIILLFDADVQLDPEVIRAMCYAFSDCPRWGAVAVGYQGQIPSIDRSRSYCRELCRIWVSKAINHFDQHCARLDGKGYGYRRWLIDEFPSLTAVDTWLEGVAWYRSAGCVYLSGVYVRYLFPQTFEELVTQYIRYAQTSKNLSCKYPKMLSHIRKKRRQSYDSGGRLSLMYRMIGWLFLRWIDLKASTSSYREEEKWEVIQSTKHGGVF